MQTQDQNERVLLQEKTSKEYTFDKFARELASDNVSGKRALQSLGALLRSAFTSNQDEERATATSFLPVFPPHPGDYGEFFEAGIEPEEVDYETLYETICGTTDDSQPVEQYDGTLGVTTDFVNARQPPVGNIHWNDNLGAIYTNPGDVSGARWCSGTLISEDLFLTAGHCFDSNPAGWTVPRINGTPNPIPPAEIATNMHVDFNYQVDPNGTLRTEQSFDITQLEECRLEGLDYAIVRLDGRPGDTFGFTRISPVDAAVDDMICIIGHPAGRPKRIEAGPVTDFHDTRIGYNDIDTLGGNSGSGIVQSPQQTIVGVHTNGGCNAQQTGHNHGQRISSLRNVSPLLRSLISPRWASLEGVATSDPGAVLQTGGRLVVFVRGTDNAIWHRWQVTRNGEWSGWESVGAPPGGATSGPDTALNDPGGLVVFARGGDNAVWHAWQDQPDGEWF